MIVVVSREDVASLTIRDALLDEGDWEEREPSSEAWQREWAHGGFVMIEKDGLHLHYDGVDADLNEVFDTSLVVFVSRHSGDTGPLLTAHHTGNFGDAEYGGEAGSLATPAPSATRHLLRRFTDTAPEDFDVGMEATHHGPTELETPSLFAEIGSGEDEWEREDAARAVADAVLSLPEREEPRATVVGVGGGHYAPRFTRVVLETDAAVGHIAADYALEELDYALLREAYESSDADALLFDGDAAAADSPPEATHEYPVVTETYLRQRAGVPETTAEAVFDALGDGACLTERAAEGNEGAVGSFDAELVREAHTIDREANSDALEAHALGYTEEGGQVSEVAVSEDETRRFAESLAEVLREKYDTVRVEEDRVVAKREVFDADRARELGVEEGPAFGRLSSGETVEVDGRTVTPEEVHAEEVREFRFRFRFRDRS